MDDKPIFIDVGIDSIGFSAPRHYIDLQELALERGVNPNKLTKGLLLKEMRFPDFDEDIISLALKAGYNALYRGSINPKEIDALFMGTETMTYSVKSVSNILVELLGISKNSLTQDIYNACAAQTLAILNALALIENGVINKALVIGADISYYDLGAPGELTQGSGAVAFVISKKPRILSFSKKFGKVSSNINDFFVPANEINAQVFGNYSVEAYLKFQIDAYDDLINQLGDFYANYYVFHAPFAKLPLKCMQQIVAKRMLNNSEIDLQLDSKSNEELITKKINSLIQNIRVNSEAFAIDLPENGLQPEVSDRISDWIKTHFKERSIPQLKIPLLFGNMYSASVWGQVIYLLENYAKSTDTIYFGSYGSGATCISGLLKVNPGFKGVVERGPNLKFYLDNKIKRSVKEYELIRQGLIKNELNYGYIIEHEKNNGRGFILHFCDEGCLIPAFEGLDYCPKGHQGYHKKFFPLYAILKSDPIKKIKPESILNEEGLIRITPDSKKETIMEFDIRRVEAIIDKQCKVKGLLNWIPIYIPTNNIF